MAKDQQQTNDQTSSIYAQRIRDIEEKHDILKDRILLIGKNLIETKENTNEEITEIKKNIEKLTEEIKKIKDFIETISGEISKSAKKEDVEILQKQAKIFQPIDFIRREELKEELKKVNH